MIIKKVTIENFMCYYGVNEFELSEGLNIILGENGEGKTKFFEALDWLFNDHDIDFDQLISAKAQAESEIGDEIKVKVSIEAEHFGEKNILRKYYLATKKVDGNFEYSNKSFEGIYENNDGEREKVNGDKVLEYIFPTRLRKYSMFKGEAELDIFNNTDALGYLIEHFSEAKHYNKYSRLGEFLLKKANKEVEESSKLDKKNASKYKELEYDILNLEREKSQISEGILSAEIEVSTLKNNIENAERYVNNAEALETINKRINKIKEDIDRKNNFIDENYTTSLFDRNWILLKFENIQKSFSRKINELSLEKRTLQSRFDQEKGKKAGKKEAATELLELEIPLPVGVPSQAHMLEMIDVKHCKVCNRPAPKGSDAHNFMLKRLNTYLSNQEVEEEEEEEVLFENDFTSHLVHINRKHEDDLKGVRSIKNEIKDLIEFNRDRKSDVKELEDKLEKEIDDRKKIIGSSTIGEEKLVDILKNYNAWQNDLGKQSNFLTRENITLESIEKKLKNKIDEKNQIDIESAQSYLIKRRNILKDISDVFNETKEKKFDEFIQKLEKTANHHFEKINLYAFTGVIKFEKLIKSEKIVVDLKLVEDDGRIVHNPNQSLETSMHISVLFAISELAQENNEGSYPLIFDAPTSSFGENKTAQFLSLIHETGNQKILLLKDFLVTDKNTKILSIKDDFEKIKRDKAFWVKLERPFDKHKLSTINTEIIPL